MIIHIETLNLLKTLGVPQNQSEYRTNKNFNFFEKMNKFLL